MRQRLHEAHRKQDGFTLIELLIVIVILGVLAGIVVIAVGAFDDRGRTAACQADKRALEVAAEAYKARTGGYPAAAEGGTNIDLLVDAEYLREPPSTTNGYVLTLSNDGTVTSEPEC